MKKEIITYITSDWHIPYHDPLSFDLFMIVLKERQPQRLNILGDAVDLYSLSRFDKDPRRSTSIKSDILDWLRIMDRIRNVIPTAEIRFTGGNHEDRLRRYLWTHASAFDGVITIEKLMRFSDFDIEYLPDKFFMDGILFTHGNRISQYASYTAKREHDRFGCNGFSGHTHRMGWYPVRRYDPRTLEDGVEAWYETGCMCSMYPDYVDYPNWIPGWVVLQNMTAADSFNPSPVIILPGYKCFVDGELYRLPGGRKSWERPRPPLIYHDSDPSPVDTPMDWILDYRQKKKRKVKTKTRELAAMSAVYKEENDV